MYWYDESGPAVGVADCNERAGRGLLEQQLEIVGLPGHEFFDRLMSTFERVIDLSLLRSGECRIGRDTRESQR